MDRFSDATLGAIILVVLVPSLYFLARAAVVILGAWSAYRLSPLAPAIAGTMDRKEGCIRGLYCGNKVVVSYTPQQSVGSGDSSQSINAFHIQVADLPGKQNWRVPFELTGMLGQGPKRAYIETRDDGLRERLRRAGVLAAVEAVSAPTLNYVTVDYDCRVKMLTFTDDVSPRVIPTQDAFAVQLALVARLVEINRQVNSV